MNQAAAIYTRVSSDRQKESDTIASQTAALVEYARLENHLPAGLLDWEFCSSIR
jgi:DNA invertase Pin-like site-specific DNA recombinase